MRCSRPNPVTLVSALFLPVVDLFFYELGAPQMLGLLSDGTLTA